MQELADLRREPLATTRWRVYSGAIPSVRVGKRARRIRRDVALASCGLTAADDLGDLASGRIAPRPERVKSADATDASTAADVAA